MYIVHILSAGNSKHKVAMSYINYDELVSTRKVRIVNWPKVLFVNPSEIGNLPQMRTLHDAWTCGAARWVKLSAVEVITYNEELIQNLESGAVPAKKPHKKQSDAGKKRTKVIDEVGDNVEDAPGPSKRPKTTVKAAAE